MTAPTFTVAEFRDRIARQLNGGQLAPKRASSNPALLRQPTDRGYYPPQIESELARLQSRYELETDEGGTAREKAIEIWKVGRQ